MANLEGISLRPRMLSKLCVNPEDPEDDEQQEHRLWRKKLSLSIMSLNFTWVSFFKISLLVFLVAAIATACYTLPTEKVLKGFLYWIENDLGPWGPLVLAIAYIPLTVLAVPASILTLGGGYLFGLPVGFAADSTGAAIGATAAFLVGRTIGRSYVLSKLKDYPKFQSVAIAIQKSGFKIVLLLRLVPLLPFNMLNYLLSITPVPVGEYILASWLGMMPITFILVYVGTTLKDLSDVTHGWDAPSKTRWVYVVLGFLVSGVLMVCVTRVAKRALEKALAENNNNNNNGILPCYSSSSSSPQQQLPIMSDPPDLHHPLIIKIDHQI